MKLRIYILSGVAAIMLYGCRDSRRSEGPVEVAVNLEQVEQVPLGLGRLVQLETSDSSLIYDICALMPTWDNWIVQSRSFVRVFDKTSGKYLKDISRQGTGPGEYLGINHIWADNDTVHLFDSNSQCIFDYTTSGDYLGKSMNLNGIEAEGLIRPSYAVASPDKTVYYVINCYAGGTAKANPQYSIISKNGEFVQHVPGRELQDGSFTPDRMYTDSEHGRVLAWEQLRDTLFTVDPDGVHPVYTFNFGKNRFPLESQAKPFFYQRVQDFNSNESEIPYASLVKYFQTKGDNLFFSFITDDNEQHNEAYLGVYNEKTGKMRVFRFVSDDGRYKQQVFFRIDGDNLLIALTDENNVEANPLVLDIPISSFLK